MLLVCLAAAVFVSDWLIKRMVQKHYGFGRCTTLFKGRVCLCRFYNPGAAMGFLRNHKRILNAMSVSSILYVLHLIPELLKRGSRMERAGLGLTLGGALNNCYERIRKGRVTDYINFPKAKGSIKHIVFNLSDFAIMLGAILLLLGELLRKRK